MNEWMIRNVNATRCVVPPARSDEGERQRRIDALGRRLEQVGWMVGLGLLHGLDAPKFFPGYPMRPIYVEVSTPVDPSNGWEQVGWYTPGMADGPNVGSLLDGKFSDEDEPVYRRVGVDSQDA